jgi:hypothetical protein
MRIARLFFAASVAACSHSGSINGPVAFDDFGSFNDASVEVTAQGGIAALSVTHRVTHDTRAFVYSQRHLCGQTCGAPLDSASGTLAANVTDSLFNIVLEQARAGLKDDYGTTPNSADMMTYTVTIRANGSTKTARANDGTMPAPMRQIVSSVRDVIAAERK